MEKKTTFSNRHLPYLLLAPQLAITCIFFLWPAGQALYQSFFVEDPFGLSSHFVGFDNFMQVLADPLYFDALLNSVVFAGATTILALAVALLLAVAANRVVRGAGFYKAMLLWPYAVAPAIAGVLWMFMFNPANGILAEALAAIGYNWDFLTNPNQAMALVVIAAAWKQISYNFLFFLAGLQAIPKTLIEAAAIDGAGPVHRFRTVVFPLLSPTTFFLMVVNIVYAFFDTFGIIDIITRGGPAGATNTLVYKVYNDGFVGLDLGGSAAQSVILMAIVAALTLVQFRFLERKVQYS